MCLGVVTYLIFMWRVLFPLSALSIVQIFIQKQKIK